MMEMNELHRVIAIDFDGTICENKWPEIGDPIMKVIDAAKGEKARGSQLILLTMREGKLLDNALAACKSWGLAFDAVNDNTEEWKAAYGNNPRKIGATEYWDDRAINPIDFARRATISGQRDPLRDGEIARLIMASTAKDQQIATLKTALELAEVVRCRDCKYHGACDTGWPCDITDDNDFCSYGERKDGEK